MEEWFNNREKRYQSGMKPISEERADRKNTIIDKCSAVIISIAVSIVGQQKYLK
jgi:hypothetical protein